jgi:hypothetical protein
MEQVGYNFIIWIHPSCNLFYFLIFSLS